MADNRTMAQMLQAPIEGYEDAIVVPQINANNFELKPILINLVQSNQFTGRQDPHNHLRFFNKVTSTFRHPDEGPSIPTESLPEKVDEQITEEILDKEHSNSSGSTTQIQPLVMPISISEPDVSRTQPKPSISYPSSFADALLLMPKFASIIKSLLANKDKLFELAKKKLSLPELTPTRMTLELVDRSITRPKGVAEDVFVKVGKFHFPTDFVMVDFEADPREPLILGRSFLRTGRALIDVYGEEITLRYNPKSSNPTLVSDDLISENDSYFLNDDSIPDEIDDFDFDPEGVIRLIEKLLNADPCSLPPMNLKLAEESKEKSSVEEPPELELKDLPSHLENCQILVLNHPFLVLLDFVFV
nr:hypothetical protein [Tanacetum cinerariifolium]